MSKQLPATQNYIEPVTFTKTGQYGRGPEGEDDVYTVAEFRSLCANGGFIDYDGFGHPVKERKADPNFIVRPSHVDELPDDATHVVWYNR